MITNQLVDQMQELINNLSPEKMHSLNVFFASIKKLYNQFNNLYINVPSGTENDSSLQEINYDKDKENNETNTKETNLKKLDRAMNEFLNTINSRQFFAELGLIERAITDFQGHIYWLNFSDYVYRRDKDGITYNIKQLSKTFEAYLGSTNRRNNIVKLYTDSNIFESSYYSYIRMLSGLLKILRPEIPSKTERGRVSIFLSSNMDLELFSIKLNSVLEIYNELINLCGVPIIDNKASIVKVESGSFWVDILGYPKVINLLTKLIEDSVSFLYRNFTNEGKIINLPRKVESIESVLELRKKLKAVGVVTNEMDEQLQKSSVLIAKQLNKLLGGEPRVIINKNEYYIGENLEARYLEQSKQALLPKPIKKQKE
jgi:hypothetical protein